MSYSQFSLFSQYLGFIFINKNCAHIIVRTQFKIACYINDNGCHVRSIAPFCHIALYMTLKDENGLDYLS